MRNHKPTAIALPLETAAHQVARAFLLIALIAMLAACGANAPASTTTSISAGGLPDLGGRTVVIGTDATYPPFESVDPETDRIVGFDVDLMEEVARRINIKPVWKNASFDTLLTGLQVNEFDTVIAATTITEEREKVVDFSAPYLEVGQLVVTNAQDGDLKSYEDLAHAAAVGVQTGTTGEEAALTAARVPDANLRRYQTVDLAFADLANGSIDAVVADGPTVGAYTAQEQYAGRLKIVGQAFTTESYGIAVSPGDADLLNAINAALAEIPAETMAQLKDTHQIK